MPKSTDTTLSLFEPNIPVRAASWRDNMGKLEWSYSKRGAMEQCPRRYYYDYYGASQRVAKSETLKTDLRKLKSLQNRHERAGEIVHLIIASYFRKAQKGDVLTASRLQSWARKLWSEDVAYSEAMVKGEEDTDPDAKFPPAFLTEIFYEHSDARERCAEVEAKMLGALKTFAENPRYERIRLAGRNAGTKIEARFHLPGWPCRVAGVVDFAGKTKETPGIVDWKMGQRSLGEDESLQLAIYAIWGGATFDCPPEKVAVCKAFLGAGTLVRYQLTTKIIADARMRILQDVERMASMHCFGDQGRASAFTACAQRRVCALCRYQGVCLEGKECLNG